MPRWPSIARWQREQGVRLSPATMSRALARLGWPLKKSRLIATERDEAARAAWRLRTRALNRASSSLSMRVAPIPR